ncbi:MAG: ATP-binding protein [Gemmatimonadota bacterium]
MHKPVQPVLPRLATFALEATLRAMPVAVLMGARQTGKSTLVRADPVAGDRPYLTLDDFDILAQARTSPDDLVRRAPVITLDEVQRAPEILTAVKRAVDESRPRGQGRFLLTGSANLLLMRGVSETLAGRAGYVRLWPLSRRERLGLGEAGIWSGLLDTPVRDWYDLVQAQTAPRADWADLARAGGYPTPSLELGTSEDRGTWFRGYTQTYLERDLQDLSAIDNLVDFRRLMRIAALRVGGLVNRADMARDAGIPQSTIRRYLNLLEASFQVVHIEPYSVNRTKRLVKSPKLYWSDTGLAMHLAGEDEPRGEHLENLVLSDLLAWRDARVPDAQILFWRTHTGEEVDLVVESSGRLLPVEVKASPRVRAGDDRHLQTFRAQYGDAAPGGLLLHSGEEVFWAADGILAAPWWRVV